MVAQKKITMHSWHNKNERKEMFNGNFLFTFGFDVFPQQFSEFSSFFILFFSRKCNKITRLIHKQQWSQILTFVCRWMHSIFPDYVMLSKQLVSHITLNDFDDFFESMSFSVFLMRFSADFIKIWMEFNCLNFMSSLFISISDDMRAWGWQTFTNCS